MEALQVRRCSALDKGVVCSDRHETRCADVGDVLRAADLPVVLIHKPEAESLHAPKDSTEQPAPTSRQRRTRQEAVCDSKRGFVLTPSSAVLPEQ